MQEFKTSKEEYVASKASHRVGKLKWWYLVLLAVGLLALILLGILTSGEVVQQIQKVSVLVSPISSAYAQPVEGLDENSFTPKVLIMAGIFVVLGIVYVAGIFKLFFSGNSDQIESASDLVKTLTGFFVGAATGLLG